MSIQNSRPTNPLLSYPPLSISHLYLIKPNRGSHLGSPTCIYTPVKYTEESLAGSLSSTSRGTVGVRASRGSEQPSLVQSGLELWLSPTTGVLSHVRNSYTLSSIFFIFGPSGPGDHTTGSTALNLGMLHACFDQQGAAAISIVETGKLYIMISTSQCESQTTPPPPPHYTRWLYGLY